MPKIISENLRLAGLNSHLKDIFFENAYLELGSINYHVLPRLLNQEVLDYTEIVDFNIEQMGIGYGNVLEESIKNSAPFLFFENLNHKNRSIQIFITYGLISYTENKKERFAPLVLFPVNMFYLNNSIKFQLYSKPIENKVIVEKIIEKNKSIVSNVKLDNVVNIDKYILSFNQLNNCHVSFESYLTYAFVKSATLTLDRKKFKFKKESFETVRSLTVEPQKTKAKKKKDEKRYLDGYFGLDNLTTDQLHALYNARMGNSFAIRGRISSGKTTTLLNIAYDQMAYGNNVLYVSNSPETIESVKNRFSDLGLSKYLIDLTLPTTYLPNQITNYDKTEEVDTTTKTEELKANYRYIKEYEQILSGRVNDFRYNEVLTNLSLLQKTEPVNLKLDNLIYTYKHEYNEILESINTIQNQFNHFGRLNVRSFSKSKFNEIPITLDSELINQKKIINILSAINDNFDNLVKKVYELYRKYNFKRITSFGQLGQTRSFIEEMKLENIPRSWIEETGKVFDKAKNKFVLLEDEIFDLETIKFDLNSNYHNYKLIKIDQEIQSCLGVFFTIDDGNKIDEINRNYTHLQELTRLGPIERETFVKTLSRVRRIIGYSFSDEIDIISKVVEFTEMVNKFRVSKAFNDFLDKDYYSKYIPDLEKCIGYLKKYNLLNEEFKSKYHKQTDDVEVMCEQFKKYQTQVLVRFNKEYSYIRKYVKQNHIKDLTDDINLLENLVSLKQDLVKYMKEYEELTNINYDDNEDVINNINEYVTFIASINDRTLKKKIIEYVSSDKLSEESHKYDDKTVFNRFALTFRKIMEIHSEFSKYIPINAHLRFSEYLQDIMISHAYFREVFESNRRMKEVIVGASSEFVNFEEYISLKGKQELLYSIERSLVTNEEFKYLYGQYYKDVATSTNQIKKVITFYENYRNLFKSNRDCYRSFNNEKNLLIRNIFDEVSTTSFKLTQLITNYNIIFKVNIRISYYNNSFKEVRNYLRSLLSSKEELTVYLTYLTNIQVLRKYKLSEWVDYLVYSENLRSVVNDFKYSYFKCLNDNYLIQNSLVSDTSKIEAYLERTYALQRMLCEDNIKNVRAKLKKITSSKVIVKNFTSYDDYIERCKDLARFFIVNTTVANTMLNVDAFDICLIDDSSLSSSDDYGNLMKAKQVIIAGSSKAQSLFASDIISRMRNNVILDFERRYSLSPIQLSNELDDDISFINSDSKANFAVEVLKEDVEGKVCEILGQNPNAKINIYTSITQTARSLIDNIINRLNKEFEGIDAISVIRNNINISDLRYEYSQESDVNIIYLQEYTNQIFDNNANNFYDYIMQTKRKLYIYDNQDILSKQHSSIFVQKIQELTQKKKIYNKDIINPLLAQIANLFSKYKIKAYSSENKLDLILDYQGKLHGLCVFFAFDSSSYQLTEDYTNVYLSYKSQDISIYKLYLYDLSVNMKKEIEKIAKDIING